MTTDLVLYLLICLFAAGLVRRVGQAFGAYGEVERGVSSDGSPGASPPRW